MMRMCFNLLTLCVTDKPVFDATESVHTARSGDTYSHAAAPCGLSAKPMTVAARACATITDSALL
jgi:hypothetical protein